MIPRTEVDFLDHDMPVFWRRRGRVRISTRAIPSAAAVRTMWSASCTSGTCSPRTSSTGRYGSASWPATCSGCRTPRRCCRPCRRCGGRRASGHRRRRVRRHGRDRGTRGPRRGAGRGHSRRIRRRERTGTSAARRCGRGRRSAEHRGFRRGDRCGAARGPYETVAGFVVNRLGHLPRPARWSTSAGAGSRSSSWTVGGSRAYGSPRCPVRRRPRRRHDATSASDAPDTPNGASRAAEAAG